MAKHIKYLSKHKLPSPNVAMAPKGKAAAKNRAAPTKATRMACWMTMRAKHIKYLSKHKLPSPNVAMAPKGKAAAKNRAAPTKATRMACWMTMSSDKDWKPWEQDEVKFTCGQLECSRDASGYARPDDDAPFQPSETGEHLQVYSELHQKTQGKGVSKALGQPIKEKGARSGSGTQYAWALSR